MASADEKLHGLSIFGQFGSTSIQGSAATVAYQARPGPSAGRALARLKGEIIPLRITIIGCGVKDLLSELRGLFPGIEHLGVQPTVLSRQLAPSDLVLSVGNLGSYLDLAELNRVLETRDPQIVVLSRILDRLPDPRPLLRITRRLLMRNAQNRAVITVSQRSTTPAEPGALAARGEVRNWSQQELESFLTLSGFHIEHCELQPVNASDHEICVTLSANIDRYEQLLRSLNLPPPSLKYLLCSTEHSACSKTGGIGSYAAHLLRLSDRKELGFLYVGDPALLPDDAQAYRDWILRRRLIPQRQLDGPTLQDEMLELAKILVYLYPKLNTLELQDYQALGFSIVQAKRAALLPPSIEIKIRCHGSLLYLEECFSKWLGRECLRAFYEEKVAIEQADRVSFPSVFLKDLYLDRGYELKTEAIEIEKYPFDFSLFRPVKSHQPIDTLIFFGKRTLMKGFPLFVDALKLLRGKHAAEFARVREVIVIGAKEPSLIIENRYLKELSRGLQIVEFEGSSAEAVALITAHADRGLCILPYQSDNSPLSVLEAVATGCQIAAASSGGIPELVPERFHAQLLHEPNPEGLCRTILSALRLSGAQRDALTMECLEEMSARHGLGSNGSPTTRKSERQAAGRRSSIGVIVPCFNVHGRWLRDLIDGLNKQTEAPQMVCFVDDGSTKEFADILESRARQLQLPYRIVHHEQNRGLAAARNSALMALEADYIVNIDADDVPLPEFVQTYRSYLDRNSEVAAVTSWSASFEDEKDWRVKDNVHVIYRPLGDGVILAQTENHLGHANSAFRREALLKVGGWDASEKSMWEDWALFLRLLSEGMRIGVVPEPVFLYRVQGQSMVRTYRQYPASKRLARQVSRLSRFDAFRLQANMRGYGDLAAEHERIKGELRALREQPSAATRYERPSNGSMLWSFWELYGKLRGSLGLGSGAKRDGEQQ